MERIGVFNQLNALLEPNNVNEHSIHQFLKKHDRVLLKTFATSWNYTGVFHEVQLGAEYRVDFIVLCANSVSWEAHLVELKSPSAQLYSKSNRKSQELDLLERQLHQRAAWVESYRPASDPLLNFRQML